MPTSRKRVSETNHLNQMKREFNFLKVKNGKIVDSKEKPVWLKGVNLGGWLMMEGYIMHASNRAVQLFKKEFSRSLGQKALVDFESSFNKHFITQVDFETIAQLGFNCIRLPFNYRLIEKKPYQYDQEGIGYLDQAIRLARQYGLWVILDLHAAPGAQNHDWHSDSLGQALLWTNVTNQKRTLALWEFLADRYKAEPTIAGYDLLNEPVLSDTKVLNRFYQQLIKTIRRVDPRHILFVEGNTWAQDLVCLDDFVDDNLSFSVHAYQPLEFTCNFVPHLKYPLRSKDGVYGQKNLKQSLAGYAQLAEQKSRPVFVGEFGVNYREGTFGEIQWLEDILAIFKEFNFHWTYWTYKAIKNSLFPDGIFSYFPNSPWVNRHGPLSGWETYSRLWKEKSKEIIASLETKNFKANELVVKALTKAAKSN